ncbi:hypothetical protein N7509_013659 [Penicillium cosmopolitanum]|uniref:BTB domain-containing protein n=1 Tax=Penicillium cosmopolitanum TaxID=1131564 RepID=A0A9W9SDT0_9EURO|nr:uncharacterized protein N7509_013659 [Penicillium cosmopolitanum]KAJ5376773.1 hypothetical protein N7509_013659 [Penicillium cosmopolitanum]
MKKIVDDLLNEEEPDEMTDWSDIDSDTFRRLCQFSYDGDYTPLQTQRAAKSMSDHDALSHLVRPGSIGETPGMNAPGGIYAATAHSHTAAAGYYPAPGQIDATSAHKYIPVLGYAAAASEGAAAIIAP